MLFVIRMLFVTQYRRVTKEGRTALIMAVVERHANVVRFFGTSRSPDARYLYLVQEFCPSTLSAEIFRKKSERERGASGGGSSSCSL